MGHSIDYTTLEIEYDGHGVPDFHRCFGIDRVLRQTQKWEFCLRVRNKLPNIVHQAGITEDWSTQKAWALASGLFFLRQGWKFIFTTKGK